MVKQEVIDVFDYLDDINYMDSFYKNVSRVTKMSLDHVISNKTIMSSFFLWSSVNGNFNIWSEIDDEVTEKFTFECTVKDFYDTLNDYLNIHPELIL